LDFVPLRRHTPVRGRRACRLPSYAISPGHCDRVRLRVHRVFVHSRWDSVWSPQLAILVVYPGGGRSPFRCLRRFFGQASDLGSPSRTSAGALPSGAAPSSASPTHSVPSGRTSVPRGAPSSSHVRR
jgi:hypothetical protein